MDLAENPKQQAHIITALKHRGVEFKPSYKFAKDKCTNKAYLEQINAYLTQQSDNLSCKGVPYFKIYKKGTNEI